MFSTPAMAQTVGGAAAAGGGPTEMLMNIAPILLIVFAAYFLFLRPQSQRAKAHQAMVTGLKRGDTVVLSSGLIGKVVRVEDTEVGVEIAQGVTVKVVKAMIAEVRARGAPAAANDAKA
jgi:preprotein translocase subunit YajC